MFRSFLGRLCTYGLVVGVNALPFAALAVSELALPAAPVVFVDDEPEGEDARTARWTPIPAFPDAEHDAGDDEADGPDAAPVTAPATPAAAATVPVREGGARGTSVVDGGTGRPSRRSGPATEAGTGGADATGAGDGAAPKVASRGRRPGKRSGKSKQCDKPHPQIHPGGDGIVEIDRSLVDEYTRNLESFMKLGYSRPFDEEGVEGWYISGFSCASPVAKAGFKRGDVLLTVNGKKTRSWVGVFMLYQRLKNKDDFEVELVRKGEPVTLRFRVVG